MRTIYYDEKGWHEQPAQSRETVPQVGDRVDLMKSIVGTRTNLQEQELDIKAINFIAAEVISCQRK